MNILYLAHRIPYPPNKGDKLRAFNEIKYLSKNHTIHLFSLTDNRNDLAYTDDLLHFCKTVDIVYKSPIVSKVHSLLALPSTTPLTLRYFFSRKLEQLINQAIQNENIEAIFVCSAVSDLIQLRRRCHGETPFGLLCSYSAALEPLESVQHTEPSSYATSSLGMTIRRNDVA